MSNEAWNKVEQTHDTFRKIIEPLKEHLGIDFGYMIVFNDGRYFQIIENLECLHKWITNVETSHIFCARNVTTYFDGDYNFTIWPEEPTCTAMEIYKEFGMWNGITVSKTNKNYTELYWFTKQNSEDGWHKWFIRSKQFLLEFITYFDTRKEEFYHELEHINLKPFYFAKEFEINLPKSIYLTEDQFSLQSCRNICRSDTSIQKYNNFYNCEVPLAPREIQILSILSRGYTTKIAALELSISIKTAQHYIERIKKKTNLHFKSELVKFYENNFIKKP